MTNSIYSIGQVAALIQEMPRRIHTAADKLKIKPAMRINGVVHYDESDVERIQVYLKRNSGRRQNGLAEQC